MHQHEPTALRLPPPPATQATTPMPLKAKLIRWSVATLGLALVVAMVPFVNLSDPVALMVLALVIFAADLLLSVQVSRQRVLSLATTFTFVTVLVFGAATAILIQVSAWVVSQLLRRTTQSSTRPNITFILFNAGQLALCNGVGGLVMWLIFETPFNVPPESLTLPLLVYASTYLLINVCITTLAIWLRYGWREVIEHLWPNVSFWTALSFGISVPLAIFVVSMSSSIGFIPDVLLTFGVLAVLSYIVRINLRFQAANRDLHVLNQISHTLSSSLELDTLLPAIYNSVKVVLPVDVFLIGLIDDAQEVLNVPFVIEDGEVLAPRKLPLAGSLSQNVLRTRNPLLVTKLSPEEHPLRFGRTDKHAVAVMMVPLSIGQQLLGVMSVQSYQPNIYVPQQLELLDSIGKIAAVAINNALLYEREKEVLRSREEFVSLVAHELKNPLAALLGHVQILERRARQADEKLRRSIGVIHEQGERMNRLVEDLLDLSRAETGRLTLNIQRIDLASLVRHVVEQQSQLTTQHQLIVEDSVPLPLIEGDALRLTQVLQNLLNNAIKYSPFGGQIIVRLMPRSLDNPTWPPRIRMKLDDVSSWIVVQISDQGIGIPEDQIGRVFERFFRAKNTVQSDVAGSGLGLSVCEGLIKAHGGVIWAESEWGEGATFSFALPVTPTEGEVFEQRIAAEQSV